MGVTLPHFKTSAVQLAQLSHAHAIPCQIPQPATHRPEAWALEAAYTDRGGEGVHGERDGWGEGWRWVRVGGEVREGAGSGWEVG